MKQRKRLEELFEIFCQCIGEEKCAAKWSEFFSAPSMLVNLNSHQRGNDSLQGVHDSL